MLWGFIQVLHTMETEKYFRNKTINSIKELQQSWYLPAFFNQTLIASAGLRRALKKSF